MHQLCQAERSWHKARRKLLITATISRDDASVVTGHRLPGLEEDLGLAGLDARTLANLEGDGLAAVGSPAPKSSPVLVTELPPVMAKSIVAPDAADTSKLKTGLATTPMLTADSPNTMRIELLGHEIVVAEVRDDVTVPHAAISSELMAVWSPNPMSSAETVTGLPPLGAAFGAKDEPAAATELKLGNDIPKVAVADVHDDLPHGTISSALVDVSSPT